jgi:hypothetical protein
MMPVRNEYWYNGFSLLWERVLLVTEHFDAESPHELHEGKK